jgi:trk system potassium uptake protein TrkH
MRFLGIPILLWFTGALGLAMAVPCIFALAEADWRAARMFLYAALFTMAVCAIFAAASRRDTRTEVAPRGELLTYAGCFAVAPMLASIPFFLLEPTLGALGAYFEAVSSLTTTGATLLPRPEASAPSLHLWRAMLGWIGGLTTLTAAAAVLGPRGLLDVPDGPGARAATEDEGASSVDRVLTLGPGGARTWRALGGIFPLYLGLTALLTVLLAAAGGDTFTALCHAMGVLSTSGISPSSEGLAVHGNRLAEAAAVVFMVLAASRLPWRPRQRLARLREAVSRDPELRLLALTVLIASTWLFGRHWLGALTLTEKTDGWGAFFAALWGTVATVTSFATTTGYVSMDWASAQNWSGLSNPTLMLLGLAALGGGVASTAGGIKLFRAFALFQHGIRDLGHLSHPRVIDRPRRPGGRLDRAAVTNAWVFTMLFLAALSVTLLALTLSGMQFDRALIGAISALANTGPAFPLVEQDPAAYAKLSTTARMLLCAAMVLGRIEVLAVVALLNPSWWRR